MWSWKKLMLVLYLCEDEMFGFEYVEWLFVWSLGFKSFVILNNVDYFLFSYEEDILFVVELIVNWVR